MDLTETENYLKQGDNVLPKIPYSKKALYELGLQPVYTGRNLDEIAFPIGGIGAGSIGLGGWGQLRDWEIMNYPNKGYAVKNSFFMLKTRSPNSPPVTKVLQGPVGGSYTGDGHTIKQDQGEGLPHFRKVQFSGNYPFATVLLEDSDVPFQVTLKAFNPFIPLNDEDSSLPVAILTYSFKNKSDNHVSATVYGNLTNITGDDETKKRRNEVREEKGTTGLYLTSDQENTDSPRYGSMTLATTHSNASVWSRWKESRLSKFWETITLSDKFPPEETGDSETGTVGVDFVVKPRETVSVTFIVAWHFPNFIHKIKGRFLKVFWGKEQIMPRWKPYYATIWGDAWDVIQYTVTNLERLEEETDLFCDTLFSSTIPAHVLDAVSSQLSTLKTNTCLRLEDGTFYGYEGSSNKEGCCPGSCTHVWNYAQALPYLFPKLQRSMLESHFTNSVEEDGYMTFRLCLPLGTKIEPRFHPAADGQMGMVLQVHREWLVSGDDKWLKIMWPTLKKLLEFSWKYWDHDKDGVMEGMQHNTYDIEFWGPNTMMGSLYLAALRAAEEIAEYLGEKDKAREYRELFEKGTKWTDKHLFNGEYYEQKMNTQAREIWPEHYKEIFRDRGEDDKFTDWPKWQYGKGCLSDQMIGQWYAHMLNLGYLYEHNNVRKTMSSIFKYNWKPDLSNHPSLLRIYAVNDEAGLIVCTWPKGERPGYAFYFADEVWCGIEYQVASHMIYEDMIDEGLSIVMGVRNRHKGDRRNPWDEFECGHHYSRSMASYSLLLALSGFRYSSPKRRIGFSPKIYENDFKVFFSIATGWGLYVQKIEKVEAEFKLEMRYGELLLNRFDLPMCMIDGSKMKVSLERKDVKAIAKVEDGTLSVLLDDVLLKQGQVLRIVVQHK